MHFVHFCIRNISALKRKCTCSGEKKWKKNKTKNVLKAVLLIKMSGDCLLMTLRCWKIQRPQRLVINSEHQRPVTVRPGARGTGAKVQGNLEAASMQRLRMTQGTTPQSSWRINKDRKHRWVELFSCKMPLSFPLQRVRDCNSLTVQWPNRRRRLAY